jgi:alginate O-acetyltransferase complex protein AlgI
MIFASTLFLFYFLPLFLLFYYLADKRYKNLVLLIAGVVFYAWGAPKFIFALLGTTFLDYILVNRMDAARGKPAARIYLVISLAINLGLLFYFKYCGFFVENVNAFLNAIGVQGDIQFTKVIMPVGISFYTFETVTYVVDVYRGVHKPLKNFIDYQSYIILFPKLIAGPIVRYHEIADQITDRSANETIDNKLTGLYRFSIGLAKKVLVANTLAVVADGFYGDSETGAGMLLPETLSAGQAWIAALAYTFQIYFDFSGYSDMAIGLGRMIGFKFPENFNHPYISQSITEFWRRWHITLGNWMKNYLYIPLGGNRVKSKFRLFFNLWIVFLLSGLWHGASWNFVLWGAWHGLFLVLDRLFLDKTTQYITKAGRVALTFFIVMIGWIFFRIKEIPLALGYIKSLFGFGNATAEFKIDNEFVITLYIAIFFSLFAVLKRTEIYSDKIFNPAFRVSGHVVFSFLSVIFIVLSASYITANGFNPFIYFRF